MPARVIPGSCQRQITYHPSGALYATQTPHYAFGVVTHGLQRHASRARQALAHHAQRITDQNALHTSRIGHSGERGVIGSQHGDFLATLTHLLQARQADRLAGGDG